MINYLLGTHRRQEPIVMPEQVQNFHITKTSVPKLPSNISSPEDTSQTSLERFSVVIERPENTLLYTRASLQLSKVQTQHKDSPDSLDPIKWSHVVRSDDVDEYGIS